MTDESGSTGPIGPREDDPTEEGDEVPGRERGAGRDEPPETAEHPTEGVHHRPEPDADNLIPADDEPGTF